MFMTCFKASLLKYPPIGERTLYPSCSNERASKTPSVMTKISDFRSVISSFVRWLFATVEVHCRSLSLETTGFITEGVVFIIPS